MQKQPNDSFSRNMYVYTLFNRKIAGVLLIFYKIKPFSVWITHGLAKNYIQTNHLS